MKPIAEAIFFQTFNTRRLIMVQSNLQGRSQYFRFVQIAIAASAIIITIKAVSVMMFASLGSTSSSKFSYVLVLQLILAAIGITSYLSFSLNSKTLRQIGFLLGAILCGVLLGFYYGGSYTDNNPQYAIFGAIAGGIFFLILAILQYKLVALAIAFISSICAYGFALITGIRGINLFAASLYLPSIIWLSISLIYIALTVNSSIAAITKINNGFSQ